MSVVLSLEDLRELIDSLELLRLRHDVCEDSWYTCPKAVDDDPDNTCANDNMREADFCTCGATRHNETLDTIIGSLKARL